MYIRLTQPGQIHAVMINEKHHFYILQDGVADTVPDALVKLHSSAVHMKNTLLTNKTNIEVMSKQEVFKDRVADLKKDVDEALHAIDREIGLIEAMIEGIH